MAEMKFPLRKSGGKIWYWDYSQRKWVYWKGGDYSPAMMVGRYHLRLKAHKWTLERYSRPGRLQWSVKVPEGISTYTAMGGGGVYTLPWEETDQHLRACRLAGIAPEDVLFEDVTVREMTFGLGVDTTPDGRKYTQKIVTDGLQSQSVEGIRVSIPGYILQLNVFLPEAPDKPEVRLVSKVYIWRKVFNGEGVSPKTLLKTIAGLGLRNSMSPWEMDLYREYIARKKDLKAEKDKGGE